MSNQISMFTREDSTYYYSDKLLANILEDEASPLNRVLNEVPNNSKILDVGTGSGLLGKLFKFANRNIIIDGIEPSLYASKLISDEYRNFYNGLLQDFQSEIIMENYDYIIFADVIEHIDNPVEVLKDFFKQLSLKTRIIISTPNITFASIRLSLLYGKFDYVDSGILEKTHVKFYTETTLKSLIEILGLNINKFYYLERNINLTEIDLHTLHCNPLMVSYSCRDKLSHVYQFFCVLAKNEIKYEEKTYGKRARFPMLEYIFKPLILKSVFLKHVVKKFYKL